MGAEQARVEKGRPTQDTIDLTNDRLLTVLKVVQCGLLGVNLSQKPLTLEEQQKVIGSGVSLAREIVRRAGEEGVEVNFFLLAETNFLGEVFSPLVDDANQTS